ncbi:MAG TPA: methylated-DNA--[protein]-cysteine S-methyltransferase [Patescibacteria group bacterium]
MKLHSTSIQTPLGRLTFIIQKKGEDVVVAAGFSEREELRQRLPKELQSYDVEEISHHPYKDAVIAYFSGNLAALSTIKHEQPGSPFSKKIWDVMQTIPAGKTITYKDLAQKSGSPAAIRAAGTVCAQNRLVLLVPCHRIVPSGGKIGNYLYGTSLKVSLLKHEAQFSS